MAKKRKHPSPHSPAPSKATSPKLPKAWTVLNQEICNCQACPRLIAHCQEVAITKRKAYADHPYWGGPVENFVGTAASKINLGVSPRNNLADKVPHTAKKNTGQRDLLIVGLAPGAHGANRTGRMFTGDRSGDWLYRALHRGGLASQANSIDRNDGMILHNCAITAVCHCAPPGNKPTTDEIKMCQDFLESTIEIGQPKVVLALGKIAWDATVRLIRQQPDLFSYANSCDTAKPPYKAVTNVPKVSFGHGETWQFAQNLTLIGSYHPSQQNTFTGRLTEEMLDRVIKMVTDRIA